MIFKKKSIVKAPIYCLSNGHAVRPQPSECSQLKLRKNVGDRSWGAELGLFPAIARLSKQIVYFESSETRPQTKSIYREMVYKRRFSAKVKIRKPSSGIYDVLIREENN